MDTLINSIGQANKDAGHIVDEGGPFACDVVDDGPLANAIKRHIDEFYKDKDGYLNGETQQKTTS
jgi:hypothetical protein